MIKKSLLPLLLAILCLLASSCHKEEAKPELSFPVKIGDVKVEDVPHFVKGVGQLVASLSVSLRAQVSGILTSVLFTDGQLVEEGDLLMTIDPRTFETQVAQSIAQLAEDRARLRYAMDFAKTYGSLVGKEYVSRLNYEEAVQNVDIYQAAVQLDVSAIKKAEIDLGFTQLRAPFKGYVGLRLYDPGNYVDAASNSNLVTINKITPLTVKFYVTGDFVQEIREKQKETPLYLEAVLPGDPSHPLPGSLWFVDNTIDPQSGLILLEGVLPNEDERGWPGQFVRVYLRLKTIEDAVLVPRSAVVLGEMGHYVFILDESDMTVKMRLIGKGFVYKDSNVVLWGLKGGEKVVVDGQLNLFDGAKVHIP